MSEQWIVIPRWDEFQHRDMARSTVPPWIKTYTRLLHDEAYLNLTGHQRAVLHGIWLEYASARRHLVLTTSSLSARLHLRVMTRDIEALNHAGFITISASRPASRPASLEVEVEVEAFNKTPSSARTTHPCTGGEGCTLTFTTTNELERHLDAVHWIKPSPNGNGTHPETPTFEPEYDDVPLALLAASPDDDIPF